MKAPRHDSCNLKEIYLRWGWAPAQLSRPALQGGSVHTAIKRNIIIGYRYRYGYGYGYGYTYV